MGFAYASAAPGSGGGSGGEQTRYARDKFDITAPWTSGFSLAMSETPVDEDGIDVWFQGLWLSPDDWNFVGSTIVLLFSFDPSTDTATGTAQIFIEYPYLLP
jgi:hypothetical protein